MIETLTATVNEMSHALAPSEIRTHQIVNVIRNGVRLRCRVMHACESCTKIVFRHVLRSLPEAAVDARSFLEVDGITEPVDDSGRMRRGTGQIEIDTLTCVAVRRADGIEISGVPVTVELVADPRWN